MCNELASLYEMQMTVTFDFHSNLKIQFQSLAEVIFNNFTILALNLLVSIDRQVKSVLD